MEIELLRGNVREPEEISPALKAALGDKYQGCVLNEGHVRLVLVDGATRQEIELARATFAQTERALDPKSPPPTERQREKLRTYVREIEALDIAALRARTANANSVPALRAEVDALWATLGQMAILMGLNDSEMGE